MAEQAPTKHNSRSVYKLIAVLAGLLIVTLAAICILLLLQYQRLAQSTRDTTKVLTERLGTVIDLPAESPTVATILDIQKLSNPTLAAKAQNNDQLIIYPNAQRIILYRPSTQKVIEMLAIQNAAALVQP